MESIYTVSNTQSMTRFADQVSALQLLVEFDTPIESLPLNTGFLQINKDERQVSIDICGCSYHSLNKQHYAVISLDPNPEYIIALNGDENFTLDLNDIFSKDTIGSLHIESGEKVRDVINSITLNRGEEFIQIKATH